MTDEKKEEQRQPGWVESMACTYCKHYDGLGPRDEADFCMCKESPNYSHVDRDFEGSITIDMVLKPEVRLLGCKHIKFPQYEGQKVPVAAFKYIPKESCLRQLPVELTVGSVQAVDAGMPFTDVLKFYREDMAGWDRIFKPLPEKAK